MLDCFTIVVILGSFVGLLLVSSLHDDHRQLLVHCIPLPSIFGYTDWQVYLDELS